MTPPAPVPAAADAPGAARLRWVGFAAGVVAVHLLFLLQPGWLAYVGLRDYGLRFIDTYALLAANDALALGLDVLKPNPLDPFHRPHVYSGWWLLLGDFGLTRADNPWFGAAVCAAFGAVALAHLRPRTGGEAAWYAAVVCSPPFLLALNRANNDLVIAVVLAPVVPCLLHDRRAVRLIAMFCIALAAALKFYPAAAGLLVLAGDDRREVRERLLGTALALALVGASVAGDLGRFGGLAPDPDGLLTFAAKHLPAAFGLSGGAAAAAVAGGALLLALLAWRAPVLAGWRPAPEDRAAWLRFVLAAVLLAGCFFAGANYAYRWVLAFGLAPFLWRLARNPHTAAGPRRLAVATAALLLPLLWLDAAASLLGARLLPVFPGPAVGQWIGRWVLAEQCLLWAFFGCLLVFLAAFVRERAEALGVLRPQPPR